jgi:8-oxo-dGTP pyrophosphatase MutT (NUDIX family)
MDTPAGLKTLLLRRNRSLEFAGGYWVFPGGRVDVADQDPRATDSPLAAVQNAAVRETHEEAGLTIDRTSLVYFSHWITPAAHTKRFATWFFLAPVAASQLENVEIDGGEIHEHRWLTPLEGMAASDTGKLSMLPPTYVTLARLAKFESVAALLAYHRERSPVMFQSKRIEPQQPGDPVTTLYHGDAGYETGDVNAVGSRHRLEAYGDRRIYLNDIEVC